MGDPRNVFLSAGGVLARYGWGKTKGNHNLKDRTLVPPPVMTHPTGGDLTSCSRGKRSGDSRRGDDAERGDHLPERTEKTLQYLGASW